MPHERLPDNPRVRAGLGTGAVLASGVGAGAILNRFTDVGGRESAVPQVTGFATGVGVPLVLRNTLDLRDDNTPRNLLGDPDTILGRVSRPSSAAGIGGGALAGAAWWANDVMGMDVLSERVSRFMFWSAASGITAGVGSALLPKEMGGNSGGNGGGSPQAARSLREASSSNSRGEFGEVQ